MKTKTRIIYRSLLLAISLVLVSGLTSCYKKVFDVTGGGTSSAMYSLSGTVKDASQDAYIQRAKILIICEDEDYAYSRDSVYTDQYGYYSYNMVHPGTYIVCFSADNYVSMTQTLTVEMVSRGESAHYPLYVAMSKAPSVVTYQTSKYNMIISVQDDDTQVGISNLTNLVIKDVNTGEVFSTSTISGNKITVKDIPVGVYDIVISSPNYYDGHTVIRISEVLREGDPNDVYEMDYLTNLFLKKREAEAVNKYYILVSVYDIQNARSLVVDKILLFKEGVISGEEVNKSTYRFEVDPGQYSIEVRKLSYQTERINMTVEESKPGVLYFSVYLPSSLQTEITYADSTGTKIRGEVAIISDGSDDLDGDGIIVTEEDRYITIHSYRENNGQQEEFTDNITIPAATTINLPAGSEGDSILLWRIALEEKVEDVCVVRVFRGLPDGTTFDPAFKIAIKDPSGGLPMYLYYRDPSTETGWADDYAKSLSGENLVNNDDITDDLLYVSIPHFSEFAINLKMTEWKQSIVEEVDYIDFNGYNGTQDSIEANYSIPDYSYSESRFNERTLEDVLDAKSFTEKQKSFLWNTYTERIKYANHGLAPTSINYGERKTYTGKMVVPPLVQFDRIKITRTLRKTSFKVMNEDDMEVSFSTIMNVRFTIDNLQPIGHGSVNSGTGVGGGIYISD